ncbi:histone-lysine N-methyltransferase, H3 lysine-79 specific-like isoform X2 [Branchiostoma floridae]|uniref:Histone-lysine N-methyltransferase, H3 lysine-79 specific-like isoform X2 n=1 Tax=Branchiostoma floridae TaxID=7739 RepID=A0A9J7MAV7_BRAFL|nr:histone-lysine N-methyltransferase, H3 lysine-79 specific-like isoform X2 [Branchiostoma floridae]
MWNSLLSPLSRGQGKQNGALKVVDQSEEYPVPSFLPSLVPPEKTVWPLPSRLARDDGEVVLPRTYLTRRGPLLLFTTPDLLMAEHAQQGDHQPRKSRDRLKGMESGITLGTVDGLIDSVLQFGLEEAADEPKGKTFLRFLKGLDERSIDMRAQPGGDLGVYLRHLKSSASRPKLSRESDSSRSDLLFLSDNSRTLSSDFGLKGHSRSFSSGIGTSNRLSSGQLLASLQSTGTYLGRPFSTAQDFASRTSNYADDESEEGFLLTKGEFYEHEDAVQSDDSTSSSSLASGKSTFRSKKSRKKNCAGSTSSKARSSPGNHERLDFDVRAKMSPQSLTITPPPPSVMESSGKEDPGSELEQHGIGTKIHVEMSPSDGESEQDDTRLKGVQSRSTTSSRRQKRSSGLRSGNGSDVSNKSPRKEHNDTGYETAEQQDTNQRLLQLDRKEDGPIDNTSGRILDNRQSSLHSSDVDSTFQSASRPGSRQNVQRNEITETEEETEERFRQNVEALRPLLPQYTVDSLARKTSFTLQSSLPDENTEVVMEPMEVAMLPHAPREVARSRSVSQSTIRTIRSFLSGEADDDDDSTDGNDLETGGVFEQGTNNLEQTTEDQVDGSFTKNIKTADVQYGRRTLEGATDPSNKPVSNSKQIQGSNITITDIDPDEKAAILAKLGYGTPTTSSEENDNKGGELKQSSDRKSSLTERDSLQQNATEEFTNNKLQENKVKKDPISIPSVPSTEHTSAEKPITAARRRLNSTERAALMAKLGMSDDMPGEKDVKELGEPQKSPGRKGTTQVPKPGSKPGSRKAARQKQPPKKKNGKKKDNGAPNTENAKPAVVDSLDIAAVQDEKEDHDERLAEELEAVQKDLAAEGDMEEEEEEDNKKEKEKAEKESKKKRAQELKKEKEELKQKLQAEKKRREEEQRLLKERIREKEEAKRREEEERRRQIEEQMTAVEMAEMDAEEASRMEEETKRLLAESRKKAREEREARRKAEQERRREEAQRRREEQKQMQLEAQQREERMRRAIGDAEERRRLAEIERKRREEEERRMEEEQRAEEERMRREAEEEEERIREAEKSAEEEAMRKLAKERREAEERKRLAKEEADRKRREEVKMKFLQELKEQEEAEKRLQAELEEQHRLEEERQRQMELDQLEADRREQVRLEAELAREEEIRRQEHNLNMRKNLAFVRHGQEFTKPWVWSYFKNVPMEVLREPYVKEDPKKNWKPKPKPKNPAPES